MENFIYSVNVTFPIFLVMVIGYILRQIGMLNENFVTVANRFNFKVTLPFMLFRDISSVDIRAVFDVKYVLFCAVVSTVCFWLIWGGTKLFLKEQSMRGAFVQASFRSSAAVMGLAFITEGAIPYAASDPLHVIPSCIIGSGVAGALSMVFNCTLMAPHGGIFVFPVVGGSWLYLVSLVIGTIVSTALLGVLKKKIA